MGSMHCRLYDENLVHNIIMSAAMEVVEYLRNIVMRFGGMCANI
jgi:hypothetical protein